MPIAAVILAGGRAERLGGANKALLEVGGRRLIDRVHGALGMCEPVLLAVGRSPLEVEGFQSVADLETDYAGPLAGLAAALDHLAGAPPEFLLSVAVDTPFFPLDFAERAARALGVAPAVLASYGGQLYPTNALWRLTAIRDLPERLRRGDAPRGLKRLAEDLGAVRLDYTELSPADPFANVNTRDDLAALNLRAATENGG